MVVGRGQQFSRPFQRWRSANQFLPLVIVQRLGAISLFVQERVPVVSNYAEMKIREIPIAHLDLWPRRIPDALGVNVKRLGFNFGNEVMAELCADAFQKYFGSLLCQLPCLHPIARFVNGAGPLIRNCRGNFVICCFARQPLKRVDVAVVLVLPDRDIVAVDQSIKVGIQECGSIRVATVNMQDLLV